MAINLDRTVTELFSPPTIVSVVYPTDPHPPLRPARRPNRGHIGEGGAGPPPAVHAYCLISRCWLHGDADKPPTVRRGRGYVCVQHFLHSPSTQQCSKSILDEDLKPNPMPPHPTYPLPRAIRTKPTPRPPQPLMDVRVNCSIPGRVKPRPRTNARAYLDTRSSQSRPTCAPTHRSLQDEQLKQPGKRQPPQQQQQQQDFFASPKRRAGKPQQPALRQPVSALKTKQRSHGWNPPQNCGDGAPWDHNGIRHK